MSHNTIFTALDWSVKGPDGGLLRAHGGGEDVVTKQVLQLADDV